MTDWQAVLFTVTVTIGIFFVVLWVLIGIIKKGIILTEVTDGLRRYLEEMELKKTREGKYKRLVINQAWVNEKPSEHTGIVFLSDKELSGWVCAQVELDYMHEGPFWVTVSFKETYFALEDRRPTEVIVSSDLTQYITGGM